MNLLEALWGSPLIHRFGCGLLHFLWQGLLIAMIVAVALRILRGRSASARYLTAWTALLVMALSVPITAWLISPPPVTEPASAAVELPGVGLPADFAGADPGAIEPYRIQQTRGPATAPTPAVPVPVASPALASSEFPGDAEAASGDPLVVRASQWIRPALPWVVCCWIVGTFALSVWRLSGWMYLRRLCQLGTGPASDAAGQMLERLLGRLRINRAVQLLESTLVEVPTVIGWLRPVILLPASILGELPAEQLELILAHELAHIRRHDYLLNLLQTAVETLLFYHPAVWWVSRRIGIEREACCDDLAVAGCGDRLLYARALTRLEELRHEPGLARVSDPATGGSVRRPATTLPANLRVAADGAPLPSRIRRVLGLPGNDQQGRRTWLGGSVAVLLLLGALVAYAATAGEPQSKPAEKAAAGEAEATPAEKAVAEPDQTGSPKPAQAVHGRVLDHQGKPVAGATVFLRGKAGITVINGRVTHGGGKRVATDAEGRFVATGGGEQATHVVVLAPHLNIWAVPVPENLGERGDSGSEGLTIKLPQPATLKVVFDVPGAVHQHEVHLQEPEGRFVPADGNAQLLMHLKRIDGEGWKGTGNTREMAAVANPGEAVIDHLAPGVYDFYRYVILRIPQGGGTRSRFAERRDVTLKPGETRVIRLVRDKGQRVEGEIEGLPEGASGALVNVWTLEESGESGKRVKPKLADWLGCKPNGRFVTSLLQPGKYRVTASAYAPRKPRNADSTGVRTIRGGGRGIPPPDYGGSAEVTIKESGPPVKVRIEMKPRSAAAKAPPGRPGEDRAKQLKANLDVFHLDLSYYPEGSGGPSNRLILYVKPTRWKQPLPSDLWAVQITKEQAEKIVDHLAAEGFLDQARRAGGGTISYRRPGYVLWVGAILYESLGWDLKMLRRLEGFRKVLDGDAAAKAMDKLLATVEPQRKLWEAAAGAASSSSSSSSGPEWGEAVEGVQVRLRATKSRWNEGRTVRLWANVRNQGTRSLLVRAWGYSCEVEVDGQWYRQSPRGLGRIPAPKAFSPGRQYDDIAVDLRAGWELKTSQEARRPREAPPELKLTGGKHTIRVAFTATAAKNAPGQPVRAVSNPVVIEVISAKEIAARPGRLKSQKNAFELRLEYHTPRDNPNQAGLDPIRSLILHTTLVDYDLLHGWSAVAISQQQAARIIDHLQVDGSLVDALPFPDDNLPRPPDGPAYSLTVKGPENLVLYKPVGWGLAVLDFLERLRTVLDGEAFRAVDRIMAGLGPQRKQWEAVAKWGQAVEGVQVRLRAKQSRWKPGTAPQFDADVRNLGTRNLLVYQASNFWTSSELEIDGRWYRRRLPEHGYRPPLADLVPGRQFDNILVYPARGWYLADSPSRNAGETGVTQSEGRVKLAPGKHTFRVAPTMPLNGNRPGDHVRVISNPVEIEVVPAEPAAGAEETTWGPVTARTVAYREGFPSEAVAESGPMYLDLETGAYAKFKVLPDSKMIREAGVDVYYEPSADGAGMRLATSNLQLQPLSGETGWNSSPGQVRRTLIVASPYSLKYPGNSTLALKTGDGRIGILQIIGFTNDRHGIRIRYKLLQPPKAGGIAIPPATQPGEDWGKAAEGVQCRLRPDKRRWKEGEDPSFKVDLRNRGTRQMKTSLIASLAVEVDGKAFAPRAWGRLGSIPVRPFGPGAQYSIDFPLSEFVSGDNGAEDLGPGKHTVRAVLLNNQVGESGIYTSLDKYKEMALAFSNPVEIEIVATSPDGAPKDRSVDALRLPEGNAGPSIKLTAKASKRTWRIGEQTPRLDVKVEVRKPQPETFMVQRAPSSFILEIDGKEYEDHAIYTAPFLPITSFDHPLDLDNRWRHGATHGTGGEPLELTAGKHTIRVLFRYGRAGTDPIEIEIVTDGNQKVGAAPGGNADVTTAEPSVETTGSRQDDQTAPVRPVNTRMETSTLPADSSGSGKPAKPRFAGQGRVVDGVTGKPVEHFAVQNGSLKVGAPKEIMWITVLQSRVGSRGGRFQVANDWFHEGAVRQIRIVADGYLPEVVIVDTEDGLLEAPLVIQLRRGKAILGRVVDHAGKGVAGAKVFLGGPERFAEIRDGRTEHRSRVRKETDAHGRFVLHGAAKENLDQIVVLAPSLHVWTVPVRAPEAGKELTIKLPQPATLVIRYGIEGDEPIGQFRVELKTWDMPEWKGVVRSVQRPTAKNQGEVVLKNMTPGVYDVIRTKPLRIGNFGIDAFCDRCNVTLESGKTTTLRFVRKKGYVIEGEVVGLEGTGISGAFVYVRSPKATGDPEYEPELPMFDGVTCGLDGKFKTAPIEPGQYVLVAHAFDPQERGGMGFGLGWSLPAYIGTAKVTVPEDGPPPRVRIEMKPRPAGRPRRPPRPRRRLPSRKRERDPFLGPNSSSQD